MYFLSRRNSEIQIRCFHVYCHQERLYLGNKIYPCILNKKIRYNKKFKINIVIEKSFQRNKPGLVQCSLYFHSLPSSHFLKYQSSGKKTYLLTLYNGFSNFLISNWYTLESIKKKKVIKMIDLNIISLKSSIPN